jgi:hypothetical protein
VPDRRIIVVKSCQKFKARQDACRATWAGELSRHGIPVWFLEGGFPETRLVDCWLLLNTGDDYDDNSFKVRSGLQFFLDVDPFDYVFVCDDNTFVHWRRWLDFKPQAPFIGMKTFRVPWVHGGGGWFMDRDATARYIAGIKRQCSWDDRLATEILEPQGVPFENCPGLFAQWDERISADNELITCHNVSPEEMPILFRDTYDLATLHNAVH